MLDFACISRPLARVASFDTGLRAVPRRGLRHPGHPRVEDVPRVPIAVRDRALTELTQVYRQIKQGREVHGDHLTVVAATLRVLGELEARSGDARVRSDVARSIERHQASAADRGWPRNRWDDVAATMQPFGMAPDIEGLTAVLGQLPACMGTVALLKVRRDGVSNVLLRAAERTAAAATELSALRPVTAPADAVPLAAVCSAARSAICSDLWEAVNALGLLFALFEDLSCATGESAYSVFRDVCLVAFGCCYEASNWFRNP